MATTVRRAEAEDALDLAHLLNISNSGLDQIECEKKSPEGMPWYEFSARQILDEGNDVHYRAAIVAEVDGDIAGFMMLKTIPEEANGSYEEDDYRFPVESLKAQAPGAFYLRNLAVFPEYRGRGLGHALLHSADKAFKATKCPTFAAIVLGNNAKMRGLCQQQGLTVVADVKVAKSNQAFPPDTQLLLYTKPREGG